MGSVIAGGNFWKGVRQGVITSGLNHVAHHVEQGISHLSTKASNKVGVLSDTEAVADRFGLGEEASTITNTRLDPTDPPKSWYKFIWTYISDNMISPVTVTMSYTANIVGGGIYGGVQLTVEGAPPGAKAELPWEMKIIRSRNGTFSLEPLPSSQDLKFEQDK